MGHWIWLVGHGIFVFAQRLAFVTILCVLYYKSRKLEKSTGRKEPVFQSIVLDDQEHRLI